MVDAEAGGIGSLPAEIVLNVLQYLDQSDVARAAAVCGDCRSNTYEWNVWLKSNIKGTKWPARRHYGETLI